MRKILESFISACICAIAAARQFTVHSAYSGNNIDNFHLRGSACGLSWKKGTPMERVNITHFKVDLQCKDAETLLEMKVLTNNDTDWMMGADHLASISDN